MPAFSLELQLLRSILHTIPGAIYDGQLFRFAYLLPYKCHRSLIAGFSLLPRHRF